MKKNSIKILTGTILGFIVLYLSSCSMEPELTDQYTSETPWRNEKNLELYLNSFYGLLGTTSYYTPNVSDDGYSDVIKFNQEIDGHNLFVFNTNPVTPSNNPLDNWSWGHNWVIACNRFIDGLHTHGGHFPEEVQLRAEAEARFFRAHVYFMMARRFGGRVVIHRDLPDMNIKDRKLSEPDECWDFIAEDLDFAAEHLPLTAAKGKLVKGGAYGLKARAMLYAKRWEAASDAAKEVIDLDLYELYPNYGDLFKMERGKNDANNKESILEVGYSAPDFGYSFDYFYSPKGDGGYAEVAPTENLVMNYLIKDESGEFVEFDWNNPAHAADPYKNRESRFYQTVLYNGAEWKDRVIETFEGGRDAMTQGAGGTTTGYYLRKLFDESQRGGFDKSGLTLYYLRYAEVLLIYAEAMAEQNDLETAFSYLNEVRERGGLKPLPVGSKNDFQRELRRERMIELAFEGHRFWDLRRWGIAKSVLNGVSMKGVKTTKNQDGSFSYELVDCERKKRVYLDIYVTFPIPTSELQKNQLAEQTDIWK